MSVSMTSRAAFKSIHDLGERQSAVYGAIEELGMATLEILADYLHMPVHAISGRVTELKRYGMVEVTGLTKNRSGASASILTTINLNDKKLLEIANDCEA
jgi:hypothetical protein